MIFVISQHYLWCEACELAFAMEYETDYPTVADIAAAEYEHILDHTIEDHKVNSILGGTNA